MLKERTNKTAYIFILIVSLSFLACKEQVIHDLSEPNANRIVSGLSEVSIKAEKLQQADGLWSIKVADGNVIPAIRYINSARLSGSLRPLPKRETSLIVSRQDQQFYYERSLSREIEYTLTSMEGVLDVRVHLNLPVRDPLFDQKLDLSDQGSGSVLIVVDSKFNVDQDLIAELVAGASGIAAEFIAVVISKGVSTKPVLNERVKFSDTVSFQKFKEILSNWEYQLGLSLLVTGLAGIFYTFKLCLKQRQRLTNLKTNLNSSYSEDKVQ